MLTAFIKSIE